MKRIFLSLWMTLSLVMMPLVWVPAGDAEDGHGSGSEEEVFEAQPATRVVTLTGYTRARHVMDIVSEEAGRCVEVRGDVGERVAENGVFAVLDRTFIDIAIKRNQANQALLKSAIEYQTKEVRRYRELFKRKSTAESKLDSVEQKLDASTLELESLKVEEANLQERRARHVIRIPLGWTIIERDVEPGEWVSTGRHLGRAGDFRKLLVPFSLSPEEHRALKNLEGPPELRFPDEGQTGVTLNGRVERISPAFDPETRKISVELAVQEGLAEMRGGLRAELTLQLPDPSGAVLVPESAVTDRYEEFWLTRPNGEEIRVVRLGNGLKNTVRVRSPRIKPGDTFKLKPQR